MNLRQNVLQMRQPVESKTTLKVEMPGLVVEVVLIERPMDPKKAEQYRQQMIAGGPPGHFSDRNFAVTITQGEEKATFTLNDAQYFNLLDQLCTLTRGSMAMIPM